MQTHKKAYVMSASIVADNADEAVAQLWNNFPELRGLNRTQLVNLAFLKFCKDHGIYLKLRFRSDRTKRHFERLVGAIC